MLNITPVAVFPRQTDLRVAHVAAAGRWIGNDVFHVGFGEDYGKEKRWPQIVLLGRLHGRRKDAVRLVGPPFHLAHR